MKLKHVLLIALGAITLSACTPGSPKSQEPTDIPAVESAAATAAETSAATRETLHHVSIQIKDYGTISIVLDPTYAPLTVENFLKLAGDGFYDGLTFHRIINGFMIQGGDPQGTGMGGAPGHVKGEFKSNGVENPMSHKRGVLSMARARDKDSASSQFFIVHEDSTFLDGDYAAFGYVTEGMEIVDKICENTMVQDKNGTVAPGDQPVIEKIEIVD